MAFTAEEKSQILYFLSYPDWVSLAASIQLGFPAASQPLYLVESAFHRLTPGGEYTARKALCECQSIECQMSEARKRFKAIEVGEVKMNPRESALLRKELLYWVTRLADSLGVVSNPYSQAMYAGIQSIGGVGGRSVGS